jgi:hypothetical protein
VLGLRSLDLTRKLNPALQTYEEFVARHKDAIMAALGG